MTPHLMGGLKLPRLRGAQDLKHAPKYCAGGALALGAIVAAGAVMSQMLPQDTDRWMRLAVWVAPASLAFLAWWWKVQR